MSLLKALAIALAGSAALLAQAPGQKGIEARDVDSTAKPCTDFYQYANGAWRAANPIPPSMGRWSRRWQAGEKNKEQLKDILDDLSKRTDWPKGGVEQLVTDHYGACMDGAQANALGAKPLAPLIAEIDGIKDAGGLQRVIRRLHEIGIGALFALYSSSDAHDPTQVIAFIVASGLGLPDRDYYLKPDARFQEARERYRAHVASMFRLAGDSDADARRASDAVFSMEAGLAEQALDNAALRDPQATDHKTSFAELQKMAPHVDWGAYFDEARIPRGSLNVTEPKELQEVNRQVAEVPLADWRQYLRWHLLHSAAGALSDPFVQEDFSFYGAYLSGAKEIKPRWKRCVESTDALLGEALGRKYVEKHFPPAAKARMQELVKNLLLAMKDTITGLDWMGPATRKQALEKLATFNPKLGYPDTWKDYSQVPIRRDSFWADVVAGRRFNVEDDRRQIGKPVDRGRWGMTPPTSDAYYNPLLNEIVFPAGILQPPAFSVDNVDAVNYGAIGVVIGHEISHGFDDQGSQFDAQGRLRNWWTAEDRKRFEQRGLCVLNQYEQYFIEPGIHHNGKLVLGEAIGDIAGLKIAYRAYHLSRQGKPPAPTIDRFTPEQQFFIAWGQFRGDATRPETARLMVQSDPHPVARFRVIGSVSNFPPFAEAFGCKAGDEMVRSGEKRCEVW
jgi:endothelin-converting enzyme/putative endopeptidase